MNFLNSATNNTTFPLLQIIKARILLKNIPKRKKKLHKEFEKKCELT